MAKNKGHKQKPPQLSFFKQQEQKYGSSFINQINTEFIRKNSLKIFRDLAYGAINPDVDYVYFNVYDFTYNLLISAQDNAKYNYYCYHGLSLSPYLQNDITMQKIMAGHLDHYNVYVSICTHLNNILQNITLYDGVYTRFYLQQLIAELRWTRNVFNGYFITIGRDSDRNYIKQERRQISNDKRFNNQSEGGFFG